MKVRSLLGAGDTGPSFDELLRTSYEYLRAQEERLDKELDLGSHERFDVDQTTGELVFSTGGIPAVIAKVQFVGSFSTKSNTWLWSWGNDGILPAMSEQVQEVRLYGERHGFAPLTQRKWAATEQDGWGMAAITNYLLQGRGVYRPPYGQGVAFLVITAVRCVEQ